MFRFYAQKFPGIGQLRVVSTCPPVRVTRQLARLSRAQMAAVLGCNAQTIQQWERGLRNNPTANRLAWLSYPPTSDPTQPQAG